MCAFRVGTVGEGRRDGACAQQGRTDGESISAPRRKSSEGCEVAPGSLVERGSQQDFHSITQTTATEPCQSATQTLLRDAPKDSVRWVLMLIGYATSPGHTASEHESREGTGQHRRHCRGRGMSRDGVTWGRTGRGDLQGPGREGVGNHRGIWARLQRRCHLSGWLSLRKGPFGR